MREADRPSDGLKRWALTLSYDGIRFFGWQKQADGVASVQAALESALSQIAGETVNAVAAGRTDTGVHATAQVVHFDTRAERGANHLELLIYSPLCGQLWRQRFTFLAAEEALHQRVLVGMEANDHQPAAGTQAGDDGRQGFFNFTKFIIHRDAQGLKSLGGRVLMFLVVFLRNGGGDDGGQIGGALQMG